MDAREVIKAVKFIKDSCAVTSCEDCDFANEDGDCVLNNEVEGAPCNYDIEVLEECIKED